MKTFRQFVTEQADPIEQGKIDANGYPCVMVNNIRNTGMGPNGVPFALIDNKRPKAAKVQEKTDPTYYHDQWIEHNDNEHLGHSVHEVHKSLVEKDKSSGNDADHVRAYTNESQWANKGLLRAHHSGETHDAVMGGVHIANMDKAVGRNKLGHDLHTYSGVTFHPGKLAAKHPEGHLHLPAYTSTSIDKETAHGFATGDENEETHVMHFHLKKGQAGKYAEPHSANKGEHEFIMPRGTTVKVNPKPDKYQDNYGGTTHVWHAHVVDKE